MANTRILLEHVPLVRRLLAAHAVAEVASAGLLGEIAYLVEELISQDELSVLDTLLASDGVRGPREPGRQRLQGHRAGLQPHVGKRLLKTGMQCAERHYEIYVDPVAQTVVHLVGFSATDAWADENPHATPAERARWIVDHPRDGSYGDGERVVAVLLAGREVTELSTEELALLAKGYNWWGRHVQAFQTARLGLARMPQSAEWLARARQNVRNAFLHNLPSYLSACDECIAAGIGPPAFWRLLKADQLVSIATGAHEREDYDWAPGDPIVHAEFLRPAAELLETVLDSEPHLRDAAAPAWVGDWNERFAAILQQSEFEHLRQRAP